MNDTTFAYRALAGVLLLGALAYTEWRKHRQLSRLREYAFLFATAGLAVAYAVVHDIITFALAPEYFFVLKDVAGDTFFPNVAWLAARAGWTAGLAIGLGLLIANNPGRREQLSYAALAQHIRFPLVWSLAAAIGGGLYARYWMPGALSGWGLEHPLAVVTVWGIHIGSYVGALLGLAHGCFRVLRARADFAACYPLDASSPLAG
ncbi:MAG: hypothetical protein AB8H86_33795 [Polyangiales bacterium]